MKRSRLHETSTTVTIERSVLDQVVENESVHTEPEIEYEVTRDCGCLGRKTYRASTKRGKLSIAVDGTEEEITARRL